MEQNSKIPLTGINKNFLKPHYLKVQAVKITKKNFQKLKSLDYGDGCLEMAGGFQEVIGEWFVNINGGYEVWASGTGLIPVNKKGT